MRDKSPGVNDENRNENGQTADKQGGNKNKIIYGGNDSKDVVSEDEVELEGAYLIGNNKREHINEA